MRWILIIITIFLYHIASASNISIHPPFISEEILQKERLNNIRIMLDNTDMHIDVKNKILATLSCEKYQTQPTLVVIDYSMPSNMKRLWIFDLEQQKLLFNTFVSHGIKSGFNYTTNFSNSYNSKASSLGIFRSDDIYHGRHGLSLHLTGLEPGFNDKASARAIVMHGSWYTEEDFIKKYGRPGRSWGCPAIPASLTKDIINTIANKSILIAYYPSLPWLLQSRYLQCDKMCPKTLASVVEELHEPYEEKEVLFVDVNNKNNFTENKPILVMNADSYRLNISQAVPLPRMLRRKINNEEFIALNSNDLQKLVVSPTPQYNNIFFVIPEIKRTVNGYAGTEMKMLNYGTLKSITLNTEGTDAIGTLIFENITYPIKGSKQFIRWIGL